MDHGATSLVAETIVPAAGGVRLSVRSWDGAAAVPFLLVHGLASNARLWDGVAARLAARGHAVAAVDQRGHGRSDKPDHGYDFATLAGDLVAALDHLGYDRPILAGQSWGADVVLELASRRPERVGGVVCVDGGVVHLAQHLPDWESCLAELGPPEPPGATLEEIEAQFRESHPDWPDEGVAGALACYERGPHGAAVPRLTTERHLVILRSLWQHRPAPLFERLAVPTLLVMCESGAPWLLDAKRAAVEEIRRLRPAVRTRWFDADHDVHAQRPDDVAALLHGETEQGGLFG